MASTVRLLGFLEIEGERMDRCFFCKEPPVVEVRGGLVFIIAGRCEVAVTPYVLGRFVAGANRALDEIYEHRGAVPISAVR